MSKEILMVVDAVSNEKGVEKDIIFEAIEAALGVHHVFQCNRNRRGNGNRSERLFQWNHDAGLVGKPRRAVRVHECVGLRLEIDARHFADFHVQKFATLAQHGVDLFIQCRIYHRHQLYRLSGESSLEQNDQ